MAFVQELLNFFNLKLDIVFGGTGRDANLFQLLCLLSFALFSLLLFFLVAELIKGYDFRNRRFGVWRDFNEVKPLFLCYFYSLVYFENA